MNTINQKNHITGRNFNFTEQQDSNLIDNFLFNNGNENYHNNKIENIDDPNEKPQINEEEIITNDEEEDIITNDEENPDRDFLNGCKN